jgi:DNA-binding beta-propeller fold protein YncE
LVSELPTGRAPVDIGSACFRSDRKKRTREVMMIKPVQKRTFVYGAALALTVGSIGVGVSALRGTAAEQPMVEIPIFEVDPLWPKPLPEEALLGMTIGVSVDAQDNVWIVHRGAATLSNNEKGSTLNPPVSICCKSAPPVIAFNQAGDVVHAWGGPGQGYEWPESMHGVHVDFKGDVWLGGNGAKDSQVLKFTKDGKFLMQSGHQGKNAGSNDPENFGRVAQITVNPKTNEAFVADGYKNKRVAVLDGDTGKIKRFWGAYGNKPDDSPQGPYNPTATALQQYRSPVHCVALANDDLLYVCDRQHDRVQVFKPDGTFLKEQFFAKNTLASGSTWEIAFSKDPAQRFIYLTDGQNERVRIVQRDTLTELASFGRGGRQPGEFYGVHSIAVDSKGNIYTTETFEGKRLQKFVYKGIGKVPAGDQGVVWPKRGS